MPQLEKNQMPADMRSRLCNFFAEAVRARARALLLDYDGTLAPFTAERDRAIPHPAMPALLRKILNKTNTRVVIVTGRPALDAAQLLGVKQIEVWGCHGLEHLRADGTYNIAGLDDRILHAISKASELLAREGLSHLAEVKPAGVAIHWRGREEIANEVTRRIQSAWSRFPQSMELQLTKFDCGLEIRPAAGNKGNVVRTVLGEMGADAAVAYLGDDATDEDAFLALQRKGLSVLVHDAYRSTAAEAWIRQEDVIVFLEDWADAFGGAS